MLLIFMNPFENEDITETKNESKVVIWLETMGRKKNTYLAGWNIPESELKEHIRTFKKKHGCNGTVKEMTNEGETSLGFQLQGDHVDDLVIYLKTQKVEQINVKGA